MCAYHLCSRRPEENVTSSESSSAKHILTSVCQSIRSLRFSARGGWLCCTLMNPGRWEMADGRQHWTEHKVNGTARSKIAKHVTLYCHGNHAPLTEMYKSVRYFRFLIPRISIELANWKIISSKGLTHLFAKWVVMRDSVYPSCVSVWQGDNNNNNNWW